MSRTARFVVRTLAVAALLLVTAREAAAQVVIVERPCPTVTYYQPIPSVSYSIPSVSYSIPSVSYYTPRVAYTPVRSVSYFTAPGVSYYPGPVTATRYGLLGQPRASTTYYPTYIYP